jgi:hypothetical protein
MSKHLTEEEKEKIIQLYNEGYNTVTTGEIIGRSDTAVGKYLKQCGLKPIGKKRLLNKDEEQKVCDLYLSGLTSTEIYEQYFKDKVGCQETIQKIVRRNGIARKSGYKNFINHNYFETIDTPEKAYFLGLILTDGNVHYDKRSANRQPTIQIALKGDDISILEKFKSEISADNKISMYTNDGRFECIFSAHSLKMAQDLEKYGIVPCKTFLIKGIPEVPAEYMRDLIRGIFDGDGTVYILTKEQKLRFGFYGTHDLIDDIVKFLHREIDLPLNKITDKETVSFITFGKIEHIKAFYDYIYYSSEVVCLSRKRDKFKNYLATHN